MGDREPWVREQLQQGRSKQEVFRHLRREGYDTAVARKLIQQAASARKQPTSDRLFQIERKMWLVLFCGLFFAYLLHLLDIIDVFALHSDGTPTLFPFIGALAVFGAGMVNGGAGVYRRYNDRSVDTRTVFGAAVGISGCIIGLLLYQTVLPVQLLGNMGVTAKPLLFLALYTNAVILFVGIVTGLYWNDRFGRQIFALPVLFLLVVAAAFLFHYSGTMNTAGTIKTVDETHPLSTYTSPELPRDIRQAATVPPPFGQYSVSVAVSKHVYQLYPLWQLMSEQNDVITSPEIACVGEGQTLNEFLGSHKEANIAGLLQHIVTTVDGDETVHRLVRDQCRTGRSCAPADSAIQQFAETQETVLTAYTKHGDVSSDVAAVSPHCRGGDTRRLQLSELHCRHRYPMTPGGDFNAYVKNVGRSPVGGALDIQLHNLDRRTTMFTEQDVQQFSDWQSKTELIDISGPVYIDGHRYRVEMLFRDGPAITAYCTGGNGFCESCNNRTSE